MTMQTNRGGVARLWLLNFVANAAALAAWYLWLLIPDAHGWEVATSLLLAACVIVLVVWLRAGTLAYFRLAEFRDHGRVRRAFRHAVRHMVSLALWFAMFLVLAWILWKLETYTPQVGVWIRQKLNSGPPPRNVTRDLNWLLMFMALVMVALWLPIASTITVAGFGRRAIRSLRVLKRAMYWVWLCLLIFLGVYLPYKLVWWVPNGDDLRKQAWSMGLRFSAAYVVLITAWIGLVWIVGVRTEREVEVVTTDTPH
jgi:hypothetical protein